MVSRTTYESPHHRKERGPIGRPIDGVEVETLLLAGEWLVEKRTRRDGRVDVVFAQKGAEVGRFEDMKPIEVAALGVELDRLARLGGARAS